MRGMLCVSHNWRASHEVGTGRGKGIESRVRKLQTARARHSRIQPQAKVLITNRRPS